MMKSVKIDNEWYFEVNDISSITDARIVEGKIYILLLKYLSTLYPCVDINANKVLEIDGYAFYQKDLDLFSILGELVVIKSYDDNRLVSAYINLK